MTSTILRSALVVFLGVVASGIYKGYQQRKLFRRTVARYGGPSLPGHSWIFGDLITVGRTMAELPSSLHGQTVCHFLARSFPEIQRAGCVYVDLWPFSSPTLATFHPDLTSQYTQDVSQPKHSVLRLEFDAFTAMRDLVCSEGAAWRKWRTAFNPGFSSQNVMALVPGVVEEAEVWRRYLLEAAEGGEVIKLEDRLMLATCDIISVSVLGASAKIQQGNSRLWWALKRAIALLYADWSPPSWIKILNPLRPLIIQYCNHVLREELMPLIKAQMQEEEQSSDSSSSSEGPKTISKLALRAYRKENEAATPTARLRLEKEFLDVTVEQMKIFLFAGHDTTSSTLCFAYAELSKHPEKLAKLRAEHDEVFSEDASKASHLIRQSPVLLNQLPYTGAVIKEILRMYPPIGTVRAGSPALNLVDPNDPSRRLPTDGFMIHDNTVALHRNPEFWPSPDDFVPERWLPDSEERHDIRKNGWRAFELGPRNCIGQELAVTEMKMLLAMTVRELDIEMAYDESDPSAMGSQSFQAHLPGELIAHPSKGLPVRIKLMKS